MGATRLLRGAHDRPKYLNSAIITGWLSGGAKSARPEEIAYVLTRWESMPDNRSIPYTHEMKSAFLAECARTGNGTHLLLKRMTDLPQGLTITIIGKWRNDASLTTIHEVHWCYVMNFLASLPSVSQPVSIEHKKKAYTGGRPEHRPISDRTLAELRFQYKRTGVGIDKLWREADNKPASLSSSIIKGWMSGQVRSAIPKHVRYVLDYYKSLPDKHPM